MQNFQRIDSLSNAQAGKDFEAIAQKILSEHGINVFPNMSLEIGIGDKKKAHSFDLGSKNDKIVVECKSHRWTTGNNIPSAKITVWNEAMYYFSLVPKDYRKIFFCLSDTCSKRKLTLGQYYLDKYGHLVPEDVEVWEYCEKIGKLTILTTVH